MKNKITSTTDYHATLEKVDRVISEGFLFKGSQVLAIISYIGLILLASIALIIVVFRNTPLAGAWLSLGSELSEFLMGFVVAFALGICWYDGGHMRIDVLRNHLSMKINNIIDIISTILFITWVGIMIWSLWGKLAITWEFWEKTWTSRIPIAPFMLLFIFGFMHFGLVLLRSLFGLVAKAMGRSVKHDGLY